MQTFLSKAKKNIAIILFIVLSMLAFNQTASAQWMMKTADNGIPDPTNPTPPSGVVNNYAVIYLAPGESFVGSITPLGLLSAPYFLVNSSVPIFSHNITGSVSNQPIIFNITVPINVPADQVNYQIILKRLQKSIIQLV